MDSNTDKLELGNFAAELGVEIADLYTLFSEYCKEMESELAAVGALARESNWQQLQRTVHNIKGVSANLALEGMFKAAEAIDLELKGNRTETVIRDVMNLEAVYKETRKSIANAFKVYDMTI